MSARRSAREAVRAPRRQGNLSANIAPLESRPLCTIGFCGKSAAEFFALLQQNKVTLLADIRLNNTSQLAGFTKAGNLEYFLGLHGIRYDHWADLAPSEEIRAAYKRSGRFSAYRVAFNRLMARRGAIGNLPGSIFRQDTVCLLCAEPTPEHCHRRLVAEMIQTAHPGLEVRHL